jgi:hypothetical protein
MVIFASEDIGMAQPTLVVANEVLVETIGLPEVGLNPRAIYLASPENKLCIMHRRHDGGRISLRCLSRSTSARPTVDEGACMGQIEYTTEDLLRKLRYEVLQTRWE